MDFTYTIKKEDFKKYLKQRHRGINIVCILFFILFFVFINWEIFINNKLLMSMILLCSVLIVCLLILITNKLFVVITIHHLEKEKKTFGRHHVLVDSNHIEDTIHKNTVSFLWKDVRNVKMTEEMITVKPKEGTISLVFHAGILKDEKFKKLQKEIEKHYKKM